MRFWLALYVWYFVSYPTSLQLILGLIFCRRYGTALDGPEERAGLDANAGFLAYRRSKIPRGPL